MVAETSCATIGQDREQDFLSVGRLHTADGAGDSSMHYARELRIGFISILHVREP